MRPLTDTYRLQGYSTIQTDGSIMFVFSPSLSSLVQGLRSD
jgi:hypothetical protein